MAQLVFEIKNQWISRTDTFKPVAKSKNYLYAQFNFLTDEWVGVPTAIFRNKTDAYEQIIGQDGTCLVPWEVIDVEGDSEIFVSVFCGDLVTANKARVHVYDTGYGDDLESSTPPTPSVYEQILNRMDDIEEDMDDATRRAETAAENAEEASAHYPVILEDYWYVWDVTEREYVNTDIKAEGHDGTSATVEVEQVVGGHRIVITDVSGEHVFDVPDGHDGTDGRGIASLEKTSTSGDVDQYTMTFSDGSEPFVYYVTNGASATISTRAITNGYRLTITDKNGTRAIDVLNGAKGDPGNGIQSINKIGSYENYDYYEIRMTNGNKTSFTVTNGYSPTVSTVSLTGGHRVIITDANGSHSFDVMDGNGITNTVLNSDYTLTITFTDGTSYTTPSIRGAKGDTGNGIQSIAKTGTSGLVDTYTITYTNGQTTTFDVTNGETPTVDAGDVPYDDTETYPDGSVGDGLSSVKAEINQLQNGKADIIFSNASGAIASFVDGADGLPVESLDINVADGTPVIVTRTGKNLIDDSIKYKASNTAIAIGNLFDYTIPLQAGTYTFSVEFLNNSHYGAYYREANDDSNSSLWASTAQDNSKSFTISEPGMYRFWLYRGTPTVDVNDIGAFQLELGSSVSAYEPYHGNTYTFTTPYDASTGEITTLLGVNNIWSNTGDTDVTYRADTKLYLESHMPEVPVEDVQVNGTSIVNQGVANVPLASTNNVGAIEVGDGLYMNNKKLGVAGASGYTKAGTASNRYIAPSTQHEAAFYGLAKAAGDSTQSASDNAVGTYTEDAKTAIREMLGSASKAEINQLEDALNVKEGARYGVIGIGQKSADLSRLWDAAGMRAQVGTDGDNSSVVNDFDHALPFMRRKCVGYWSAENGEAVFHVTAYEGEVGYAEDGSAGDYVAVECPKCYYYFKDGILGVSAHKYDGWRAFDIFLHDHDPNQEIDRYYRPAYDLCLDNAGHAVCLPGYCNAQGSYKSLMDAARTYRDGNLDTLPFLYPMALSFYEWALFTVEFATQHCQSIMYGCGALRSNAQDIVTFFGDSTHALINNWRSDRVVGMYVAIVATNRDIHHASDLATHKITALTRVDASGNPSSSGTYTLMELEDLGRGYYEYDTTGATEYHIGGRPYITGACNGVSTPSGSPVSNTNGYYPMKYRHAENIYGNQYKTTADLFDMRVGTGDDDYRLEYYYLLIPQDYAPSTNSKPDAADLATDKFVKLGVETAHENYANGYIKSKKYDEDYQDIWIPFETVGGSASTYFADYAYLVNSYAVRSVRLFGSWANGSNVGLSFFIGNYAPSSSYATFGGSLCFPQ